MEQFLKNKNALLYVLILSSIYCVTLVLFRVAYSHSIMFIFLIWNLFLAWIPYFVSIVILKYENRKRPITGLIVLVICWLAFLPNAPYILTDLFHLEDRQNIPLWYELILIASFAWTGLMLGYFSLYNVHNAITQRFGKITGWIFSLFSISACSFGVYIGRFLRWNSWDIIYNPKGLTKDILERIMDPYGNKGAYIMTILLTVLLILGYATIKIVYDNRQNEKKIINN